MYLLDCNDEWNQIHSSDLWVYNKLFLSRILEYTCGPVGTTVPQSDFYIVRPSINILGMGHNARYEWIENSTDHFHPAEFWCEIFKGEHLSVDFKDKKAELVVRGIKNDDSPLYKWKKWEKIDKKVEFPSILNKIKGNYEYINCEFIDGNLIEVHFRQNPDFRYGNTEAIPVWNDESSKNNDILEEKYKYIEDKDYHREGFYIK